MRAPEREREREREERQRFHFTLFVLSPPPTPLLCRSPRGGKSTLQHFFPSRPFRSLITPVDTRRSNLIRNYTLRDTKKSRNTLPSPLQFILIIKVQLPRLLLRAHELSILILVLMSSSHLLRVPHACTRGRGERGQPQSPKETERR